MKRKRNAKVEKGEDTFGSPIKLLNYYFLDEEVGLKKQ